MIRVAINGYGRIGRVAHRVILEKYQDQIEVVAINAGSSTDIKGWMYLLKYDTVYGPLKNHDISAEENNIDKSSGYLIIDEKKIPIFEHKNIEELPWKEFEVDVVIESTGHIKGGKLHAKEELEPHLKQGAKAVVVSAPVKDDSIPTYVLSVNSSNYNKEKLISNASCTTNCIAPVAKIILDAFGIERAMMTTIHGYTSDQRLQDGGHKDYRRARAAASNIIPTSTGATVAAAKTLPELSGKFTGLAIRVPVAVGSLSDFTFVVKRETSKDEVNNVLKKASESDEYKGILKVSSDPLVSSDIIGDSHSAIVDLSLTQVVGNMIKVIAWYDNEYGYANRLIEEVVMVGKTN